MFSKSDGKVNVLDLVIFFLCIAVIAAIILPKIKAQQREKNIELAHQRIKALSEAEFNFYREAHAPKDTTGSGTSTEEPAGYPQYYTANFDSLKPYLPQWADTLDIKPYCPIEDKELIFVVKDSTYFVIGSPSGGGFSVMGRYSWEEEEK